MKEYLSKLSPDDIAKLVIAGAVTVYAVGYFIRSIKA